LSELCLTIDFFSLINDFINEYFKSFFVLISTVLGIYFAQEKIRTKVTVFPTFTKGLYIADYISNVVITNKKDKAVSVWSVHALFEKQYQLELDKFDPPLILKPYESISISLPSYSTASIDSDEFEHDLVNQHLEFYIDIGDKLLKCNHQTKQNLLNGFTHMSKQRALFNGHVFNGRVSYILAYHYKSTLYTAFICGGMITNEWEFHPSHLGNKDLSAEEIKEFLLKSGLSDTFDNYQCYKVNFPKTELVFSKK